MQKRHFCESRLRIHDIRVGPRQILIQGITMAEICVLEHGPHCDIYMWEHC